MIPVEKALEYLNHEIPRTGCERVPLLDARHRFACKDILATDPVPPHDNSAMDGFALRSTETLHATPESPVSLEVSGEIPAGTPVEGNHVPAGQAIAIMTGAPVPPGMDCVIPVEDCLREENRILINRPLTEGENIRRRGEDIPGGAVVIECGTFIDSAELGLLASINSPVVDVFTKPRVAILATGNEIIEPGEDKTQGQIYNSNAYTLYSEIQNSYCEPVYLGIVDDSPDLLTGALEKASEYDVVVTTGGVSMGNYDFVRPSLEKIGVTVYFDRMKIKPGKPFTFGRRGQTLYFGLPGNPVSSLLIFMEFVRPVLLSMMGARNRYRPRFRAILDTPLKKKKGKRHYQRGILHVKDSTLHVSSTGFQGSGILTSMSLANCIIEIEEERENPDAGEEVTIKLIHHREIHG